MFYFVVIVRSERLSSTPAGDLSTQPITEEGEEEAEEEGGGGEGGGGRRGEGGVEGEEGRGEGESSDKATKKVIIVCCICLSSLILISTKHCLGCVQVANRPDKDRAVLEGLVQWALQTLPLLPHLQDAHSSR